MLQLWWDWMMTVKDNTELMATDELEWIRFYNIVSRSQTEKWFVMVAGCFFNCHIFSLELTVPFV